MKNPLHDKTSNLKEIAHQGDAILFNLIRKYLIEKEIVSDKMQGYLNSNSFISQFKIGFKFKDTGRISQHRRADMTEAWIWFLFVNYGESTVKKYVLNEIQRLLGIGQHTIKPMDIIIKQNLELNFQLAKKNKEFRSLKYEIIKKEKTIEDLKRYKTRTASIKNYELETSDEYNLLKQLLFQKQLELKKVRKARSFYATKYCLLVKNNKHKNKRLTESFLG